MSAKCDVSTMLETYPDQSVDAFVMKAAQKAFTKCIDSQTELSVERVDKGTAFDNMHELGVGAISTQLEAGNSVSATS